MLKPLQPQLPQLVIKQFIQLLFLVKLLILQQLKQLFWLLPLVKQLELQLVTQLLQQLLLTQLPLLQLFVLLQAHLRR